MNKQSTLERDQKGRRSRMKLHDLPAKKNLTGGSSAKLTASENGSSGIPSCVQECRKRDSLPIKSDWLSRCSAAILAVGPAGILPADCSAEGRCHEAR